MEIFVERYFDYADGDYAFGQSWETIEGPEDLDSIFAVSGVETWKESLKTIDGKRYVEFSGIAVNEDYTNVVINIYI